MLIDPDVFPQILSYLRSGNVLIPPGDDDLLLRRLLAEADFYHLVDLKEAIEAELEERSKINSDDNTKFTAAGDEYKVIHNSELSYYFQQGWEYVDKFLGDETTACSVNGSKVKAQWRNNHCSTCGEPMSYEKYVKHVSYVQPTMIVLKRKPHSFRNLLLSGSSGTGNMYSAASSNAGWTIERPRFPTVRDEADAVETPRQVPLQPDLAFDESFG